MTIEEFLKEENCFKHLKHVEIIQQENLAINLDSMYIVEKDKIWCDIIFIDSQGNKRRISSTKTIVSETPEDVNNEIMNNMFASLNSGDFVIDREKFLRFQKVGNIWIRENIEILI